jgi:hypothetical protein
MAGVNVLLGLRENFKKIIIAMFKSFTLTNL